MAAPKITYFLGAGASFDAVPIVKKMSSEINEVKKALGVHDLSGYISNQKLTDILSVISNESINHNTIDTYAKKLFFNNEFAKLKEIKIGLSICFLYWQFCRSINGPKYEANIDKRYIALVSALLKKRDTQIALPPHVHFVTWNYDIQIELAIQYFLNYQKKISDVQFSFNLFPSGIDSHLVHLNGVAGMFHKDGGYQNVIDDLLFHAENHERRISDLFRIYEFALNNKLNEIENSFYYSWEHTPISESSLNRAKKIFEETEILVIIGYSFPAFNREVDRQLIRDSEKLKKVFYQDPNADKLAFSDTFGIPENKVFERKNCDQFFLPFEF